MAIIRTLLYYFLVYIYVIVPQQWCYSKAYLTKYFMISFLSFISSLFSVPNEFTSFLNIKHFHRGFATRPGPALICRYLTVRRLSVTAGHRGGIVEVAWPRVRVPRVAEDNEHVLSFSLAGVERGGNVGGLASPIVTRMGSCVLWGAFLNLVVSVLEPREEKRKELRGWCRRRWYSRRRRLRSRVVVAEKWCDSGGGEDGGGTDGGGYTPCAVPALNYWDTTRSMSQKENGCAAWNDGLSRRSYIMHAAVSALWPARVYSCANVQKKKRKEENTLPPSALATVSGVVVPFAFLVRLCRAYCL